MSKPIRKAAVIGAGVMGFGIAWRLAQAGCVVTVYDCAEAGHGASWAAAGMLAAAVETEPGEEQLLALTLDVPSDREVGARTYYLGPFRHARAVDIASVLRQLYGEGKQPAVTIAVDPRTNSVILRGSHAVYEDARKVVERLDVKTEKKE